MVANISNYKNLSHVRVFLILLLAFLSACTPMTFSTEQAYQPTLNQNRAPIKMAIVLGGGGAKGLAHVGVLEELIKAGIQPDLIVGCSAGAVVGGLYADQPDIPRLKRLLMEKRREHLLNLSIFHLPFSLSDGNALQSFLENNLKYKDFENLRIPFVAVATNLQYGKLTPFASGPLEPAIRASAAIPGVFRPVQIHGQYFVDGGVTDNLPTEVARQMGAEFVIGVELDSDLPSTAPSNALGIVKRSLEISLKHQHSRSFRYANYVIKVPLGQIGTFDDHVNELIYEKGKEAARLAIPKLLELLPKNK